MIPTPPRFSLLFLDYVESPLAHFILELQVRSPNQPPNEANKILINTHGTIEA
jgi:hypothetical protein